MKKYQVSLKRLKRSAVAAVMTAAMAVPFVPGYAAAAGQEQVKSVSTIKSTTKSGSGDVNGDGSLGLDDARSMLQAAVMLIRFDGEQAVIADLDANGYISMNDVELAVQQILNQNVLEEAVRLPIKKMTDIPTPKAVLEPVDSKNYTYTISVDNANMKYFDYGVCYDKDVFELVPVSENENGKWNEEFVSAMDADYNIMTKDVVTKEGITAVYGINTGEGNYSGDVVTLDFRVKDGAAGTTEIMLVTNSAYTDEEALASGVKTQVDLDASQVSKGDVNGDGLIGLDDVQYLLKVEAKLTHLPVDKGELADLNGDGLISNQDTALALKHILDQSTLQDVISLPIKKMSGIPTPQVALKYNGDKNYVYTILVDNANMEFFDYGIYYDKDKLELVPVRENVNGEWSEAFELATEDALHCMRKDVVFKEGAAAVGGVHTTEIIYSGNVVTLTFRAKDGATGTTEITLVSNSAHADEEALANGIKTQVNLAQSDKVTETVSNEDGTVTEKVTETEVQPDGTVSQTVTETTEKLDGSTEEKVTETIINANGEKEATSEKTVITNKDGSTQEEEIRKLRDEIGNLVTIIEQMKKTTEDIYERLTTTEKLLADAAKQIKKVAESSTLDEQGNVVKKTDVVDEKQDANGTSTEKYEYSTDALSQDVEWNTSVLTTQEAVQEAEVLESNGAKDYRIYDISPEINGQKTQISEGKSVKVSINCADKNWKSVKVFDFEQEKWIKAVMENGFAVFTAEHFSKYAVAENTGVRGDADGDGKVTLKDAQLALRAALHLTTLDEDAVVRADVDGKTGIALTDAQLILRAALHLTVLE